MLANRARAPRSELQVLCRRSGCGAILELLGSLLGKELAALWQPFLFRKAAKFLNCWKARARVLCSGGGVAAARQLDRLLAARKLSKKQASCSEAS